LSATARLAIATSHVIATLAIHADSALFASLTSAMPPTPSRPWTATTWTGAICALTMRVTSDPTPCHVVAMIVAAGAEVVVDAADLEAAHVDAVVVLVQAREAALVGEDAA